MPTESIKTHGFTFEVDFDYYRACRGARERGTGLQLEPDEPESIEINSISTEDDLVEIYYAFKSYELLEEALSIAIFENLRADAAEAAYERYRDRELWKEE